MPKQSNLEKKFISLWEKSYKLSLEEELCLIPGRRFRFDFVHQESKVAIEIQGGVFMRGNSGHSSGKGITRDCEKSNLAIYQGYVVFKLTNAMITEENLAMIHETIQSRLTGDNQEKIN